MNTENKSEEKVPVEIPVSAPITSEPLPEALEFLKENAVAIVVGVLIAVVGFVGYIIWQNAGKAEADAAAALLFNSQTAQQYQEVVNNYPETPAAPLAMLSLAAAYFDQGQYDLALATFDGFASKYPSHDMLAVARLGSAQAKESLGRNDEALAAYEEFLKSYPEHFMIPNATFGKARVLEASGKYDEAKAVYEAFMAANPDSMWTGRAESGLRFTGKTERSVKAATGQ